MKLQEFIQTLADNRILERQKRSSLSEHAGDALLAPTREYRNTVMEALLDYERSHAGYGTSGERLANSGLSGGGYAAHLEKLAEGELGKTVERAEEVQAAAVEQLDASYREHLEQKEEDEAKLISSVMKELGEIDGVSYTSAYDYAITRGLDRESADALAKETERLRMNEYRQQVLRQMAIYLMKYDAAKKYALASGFSEAEAESMAQASQAIYDNAHGNDFNYYD